MQHYSVIQSKKFDESGNIHISYGISCEDIVIHDITFNKEQLEHLVTAMNELELACEQALAVIEDFVSCPIKFIR